MRHRSSLALLPLLALGCHRRPAAIEVSRATEVGLVPQSSLIDGHDGGASALLFGHSVWIYGDTVLTVPDVRGLNWHANSFAFTDALDASSGISGFAERVDAAGAPLELVPNTADEAAFNDAHRGNPCATPPCGQRWAVWPGSAVFDAPRNRALIWYGLVFTDANGFSGGGQSLAVWNDFASLPERPIVAPDTAHPTLLFGEHDPGFGAASVLDGDFLYTFACDPSGWDRPCLLGRVEAAAALDRPAWTFWNGSSWSSAIGDARPAFEGGLGMTVFRLGEHWVAVYAGILSNDIQARTASALTGPWSDEVHLFTADRKGGDGATYDSYVHPEFTPAGGKTLYVSYTRPDGNGWFGSETALERIDLR
jgi:hypothetical protein